MKRVNPIALRSKRQMVQSLLQLMRGKKYREISIQEICAGANLARQTFYTNFSSKDELLEYYLDTVFEDFGERLRQTAPSSVYRLVEEIFRFCGEHARVGYLLRDEQMLHLVWHRLTVSNGALRDLLRHRFCDGNEIQEKYLVSFLGGALYGLVFTWMADGMRQAPEEMARITLEFMSLVPTADTGHREEL